MAAAARVVLLQRFEQVFDYALNALTNVFQLDSWAKPNWIEPVIDESMSE